MKLCREISSLEPKEKIIGCRFSEREYKKILQACKEHDMGVSTFAAIAVINQLKRLGELKDL